MASLERRASLPPFSTQALPVLRHKEKISAVTLGRASQIMPTTLYILIITTINSFQCFALIQLLTSGGPTHSTDTIMYYIYYTAFKLYRYGYGNAMGVVLMIIIAVLSAVQFKLGQQSD